MKDEDIEIGVKIKTHIYLHTPNSIKGTPFDVDRIVDVKPTDNGSIITMVEPKGLFSSEMGYFEYEVENNVEKIKEAINDAMHYKTITLEYLDGILEK